MIGYIMKKKRKIKLSKEEVRQMMEEKLRAQSIPSKKKYKRSKKHKKENKS
jgi:hypothetical protein